MLDPHSGGFMMGGGFERSILPAGAWWRNQGTADRIGLTAEQQKKMDEALLASRVQLIHIHAALQEQELLLQPMLKSNPLDQKKVMEQIATIANTRADLEKATAKMLLDVRAVMTPDQWTKLQAEPRRGPKMESHGGQGFEYHQQ